MEHRLRLPIAPAPQRFVLRTSYSLPRFRMPWMLAQRFMPGTLRFFFRACTATIQTFTARKATLILRCALLGGAAHRTHLNCINLLPQQEDFSVAGDALDTLTRRIIPPVRCNASTGRSEGVTHGRREVKPSVEDRILRRAASAYSRSVAPFQPEDLYLSGQI
jgi:hypothetical protein